MKIARDNWEDVKRYYRGTYVKFKETGDHVWKITHVDPDTLIAVDDKGEEIGIDLSLEYEIEYVIPGKAAFQYADAAYALIRVPARQFYRGMHQENTKFLILGAEGRWASCGYDFTLIQGFVNKPVYQKIDHIIDEIKEGKNYSWALSPQICVSRNGSIVTASGSTIGKLYPEHEKIKYNKLFHPELEVLNIFKHYGSVKNAPKQKKKPEVEYALY